MNKLLIVLAVLAFVISPSVARAQSHEYSPLTEQTVNYKNWTLPNLTSDQTGRSAQTGRRQEAGDGCLLRAMVR